MCFLSRTINLYKLFLYLISRNCQASELLIKYQLCLHFFNIYRVLNICLERSSSLKYDMPLTTYSFKILYYNTLPSPSIVCSRVSCILFKQALRRFGSYFQCLTQWWNVCLPLNWKDIYRYRYRYRYRYIYRYR